MNHYQILKQSAIQSGHAKSFLVRCRAGHVGKGKYLPIELAVFARTAREAAEIARAHPRVKHHTKNAIENVMEIPFEELRQIREQQNSDPYFFAKNIQEQRRHCTDIEEKAIKFYETEEFDPFEKRRNIRKKRETRYKDRFSKKDLSYEYTA